MSGGRCAESKRDEREREGGEARGSGNTRSLDEERDVGGNNKHAVLADAATPLCMPRKTALQRQ